MEGREIISKRIINDVMKNLKSKKKTRIEIK